MIEGCKWQKAKDMKCHCAVQDAQMDRRVRYKAQSVKQTEKYFLWTSSLHVDLIINCKVVSKKLEVPLCLFLHSYQVCAIRKRLFWITLKYWQDCTDIHTHTCAALQFTRSPSLIAAFFLSCYYNSFKREPDKIRGFIRQSLPVFHQNVIECTQISACNITSEGLRYHFL